MMNEELKEDIIQEDNDEKSSRQEYSRHDFGWESFASVEESRQNQLISEIYSIMNTGDDDKLEFIKKEWQSLSEEGIDEALEERFNQAVHRYETRQERLTEAQTTKKRLIQEAEAVKQSTDWNKTATYLQKLQQDWKEAGFAGQDIDQDLWEKFRAINDVFFDRRSEHYANLADEREDTRKVKEELIERANAIKESEEWKKTSVAMRDLMTEWKQAGFAGREFEDDLWEKFNAARQYFYQKQREFFDAMREEQNKARIGKEEIIVKAEEVVKGFNLETKREEMETLFETWKQLGHSGRDFEEKLWNEFRAIQDDFYSALKTRDASIREDQIVDIESELETLEVRIDTLEGLNDKIEAKLSSLEGQLQTNESEELQEEYESLKVTLDDNRQKIDEYNETYNKLSSQADRYK